MNVTSIIDIKRTRRTIWSPFVNRPQKHMKFNSSYLIELPIQDWSESKTPLRRTLGFAPSDLTWTFDSALRSQATVNWNRTVPTAFQIKCKTPPEGYLNLHLVLESNGSSRQQSLWWQGQFAAAVIPVSDIAGTPNSCCVEALNR
jgi:hypothetical protein